MLHRLLLVYEGIVAPFRGRGLRRAIPFLERADRALTGGLARGVVTVHGRRMVLDRLDSLSIQSGAYEYFASQILLPRLVRRGQVAVDVGAHIGYYTIILADLVGPRGRVHAFEPDRANFALLRRNVALNHHRNVRLERAAVSERGGEVTLYLAHENLGDHRLFDYYHDRKGVRVKSLRLDDRLSSERVDFVKMDIQGAEYVALQGMTELLRRTREVVLLTEFAPRLLAQFGVQPVSYLRRLADEGFGFWDSDESARHLIAADVASLDARYRAETEDYTNLLCLRGELPESLREFVRAR